MLEQVTPPDAVARKFVFRQPESFGSRFAKFLVKRVLKLGQRYDRMAMVGPGFDRSKMIHSLPRAGKGVTVTPERIGNCDVHWLGDGNRASKQIVYYIHGGGFIEGPAIGHCLFVRELSARTGTIVAMIDYPKAPEHSQQEMLAAVHSVYSELTKRYGASNVTVMGDSAGGTLTLALALLLKQKGEALPARLVMLSPTLDVRYDDPQMKEVEPHDPLLNIAMLHRFREAYLSRGGDPLDPLVSPLLGDLSGLPPMYLFMGTHEILLPYARRFFDKAAASGARLEYYESENMMHVWPLFRFAEAQAARSRIDDIVRGARETR